MKPRIRSKTASPFVRPIHPHSLPPSQRKRRVVGERPLIKWSIFLLFGAVQMVFAARGNQSAAAESAAGDRASTQAAGDAEREQIWNSPEMLQARAWLDQYFAVSVQYTPKQAEEYLAGIKAMTPEEMRLWLSKFQQERQQRRQIAAAGDQMRQYVLAQNEAAIQRNQRSAGAQAAGVSGAAMQQEQRVQSEQSLQNQAILQRQAVAAPYYYSPYIFPIFPRYGVLPGIFYW
jgi:hypothetical protein